MAAKNNPKNAAPKPRKDIYGITQRDGQDKAFWTKIGVGFENSDGSWNLLFDFVPTDRSTTIQLRDPKPKED